MSVCLFVFYNINITTQNFTKLMSTLFTVMIYPKILFGIFPINFKFHLKFASVYMVGCLFFFVGLVLTVPFVFVLQFCVFEQCCKNENEIKLKTIGLINIFFYFWIKPFVIKVHIVKSSPSQTNTCVISNI